MSFNSASDNQTYLYAAAPRQRHRARRSSVAGWKVRKATTRAAIQTATGVSPLQRNVTLRIITATISHIGTRWNAATNKGSIIFGHFASLQKTSFNSSVTKPSTASSLELCQVPTTLGRQTIKRLPQRLFLLHHEAADIEDIKYLYTSGGNGTERGKGLSAIPAPKPVWRTGVSFYPMTTSPQISKAIDVLYGKELQRQGAVDDKVAMWSHCGRREQGGRGRRQGRRGRWGGVRGCCPASTPWRGVSKAGGHSLRW